MCFIDFSFLIGETVPDLFSNEDEIDEVYQSSDFRDYLANNPYQTVFKPSREMGDSNFKARAVESSAFEADLFTYRGMFKVSSMFISGFPG